MHMGFSVGVHLTLTCEYRGYRWRGLTNGASLRGNEGFFPATTKIAVQRLDVSDARAGCRAQLETALSLRVDVTHLDTHMNVLQAQADLYEIYLDLAAEFRPPVRMFSQSGAEKRSFQSRVRAEARGLLFNEHIVNPWPRRTRDVFFEEIPKLPPGVSEIFTHPVLDGEVLRAYDTDNADIRAHDTACLNDPMVSDLLELRPRRRHGAVPGQGPT